MAAPLKSDPAERLIVIAFYSLSCLGQETAKEPFDLRVNLPPVYHTRWRFHIVPLIAERQAGKLQNTNFIASLQGPHC